MCSVTSSSQRLTKKVLFLNLSSSNSCSTSQLTCTWPAGTSSPGGSTSSETRYTRTHTWCGWVGVCWDTLCCSCTGTCPYWRCDEGCRTSAEFYTHTDTCSCPGDVSARSPPSSSPFDTHTDTSPHPALCWGRRSPARMGLLVEKENMAKIRIML